MTPQLVRKRDGQVTQDFSLSKIIAAVRGAWTEVHGVADDITIVKIARDAYTSLVTEVVDVESIQDAVEVALMRAQEFKVARAYILYRDERAKERGASKPDPKAIAQYIHASKYARFRPELGRREVYEETVARVEDMHLRKFSDTGLESEIRQAFDFVRAKKVLPSMRTLQFGGVAMEANHCRGYNCTATLIDRPRAFSEALYLLLSGCGVGYSVQYRHVEKLPPIAMQTDQVVHHVIEDDIEGWADAADALVNCAISGLHVEFAYHKLRDKGALLKTSGGRAPGHLPLRRALERARGILLGAQGRQLRPMECHEILCHFADAVLAGGIRRSAMICLFSLDDGELLHCKADPAWFKNKPWLARANNSVVLKRDEVTLEQFLRIFKMTKMYGEPGFFFVSCWDHVCNPCAEIGLDPVRVNKDGSTSTGWAFCNLTEINAALLTSAEDFIEVARAATLIGTLQAAYTTMPYLGSVTEDIVRRDALIGVGMTGMQDAPAIALDPELQSMVADLVVRWNIDFAAHIGINPAARATTVKPSGTTTLELSDTIEGGAMGSGIHFVHAEKYIRRVTANELEPPFQAFRAVNPAMCEKMPDGNWSISFPVKAGEKSRIRGQYGALDFLDMVRSTYQNWIVPGTGVESAVPGLRHNVSNTVSVKEDEWDDVATYLYSYRWEFGAVSFLPDDGDAIYAFAPFESVKTPDQERRWRELIAAYKPVDYLTVREDSDTTSLSGENACAGGACAV